jgi:hypothetical protein
MNIAIAKPKLGKDFKAFLAKKHQMLIAAGQARGRTRTRLLVTTISAPLHAWPKIQNVAPANRSTFALERRTNIGCMMRLLHQGDSRS